MKNNRQPDNRKSQLAQIHIAKAQLGMADDTYRSMLFMLARVQSAADLDDNGRNKVLLHLKACGFKAKASPSVAKEKQALISKIAALLADMRLDWAYADGVAKRMYKRDKAQWCKPKELLGLITALVKKQQKQQQAA